MFTNGAGNATFDVMLASATTSGEWITATATDACGNTSEFSLAVLAKIPVLIDVKPGESASSLNLASNGMTAVVLYSTSDFDARSVDIGSVVFAGAAAVRSSFEDVDGDGDLDAVFYFRTQDTNLKALYTDLLLENNADGVLDSTRQLAKLSLTGKTTDNLDWVGTDQLGLSLSGEQFRTLLDQLYAQGLL